MASTPTAAQLAAARGKTIRDVLGPGLTVVFCGINPGLYSGAVGHHFARPGNRFWPALHRSGWTDRQLAPAEDRRLLDYGCGVTNLVARTTATAAELAPTEFVQGAHRLERKIKRLKPRCLAVLGIESYRKAFGHRPVKPGRQDLCLGGTRVWVLPNPSGLNAHYQLADFVRLFAQLRRTCCD